MKKIFFILVLFFAVTSISYSQIINGYGIKIGGTFANQDWNYSNLTPITDFNSDSKLGFNAGIFVDFFNLQFMSFLTELNFVQKGMEENTIISTMESPEGVGTVLWKLGINYLNFSILAKPKVDLGVFSPYLLLGPRIDFEVGKTTNFGDLSSYDNFNKNKFGVKFGLGTDVKFANLKLLAEFVYDLDITNLYKNENVEITSNSFDIRVGIYL